MLISPSNSWFAICKRLSEKSYPRDNKASRNASLLKLIGIPREQCSMRTYTLENSNYNSYPLEDQRKDLLLTMKVILKQQSKQILTIYVHTYAYTSQCLCICNMQNINIQGILLLSRCNYSESIIDANFPLLIKNQLCFCIKVRFLQKILQGRKIVIPKGQ